MLTQELASRSMILKQVTQLDHEFGVVSLESGEPLYGTLTHTSLYDLMDEIGPFSNNSVFIDLGSGMGSLLFYMYERFSDVMKLLIGVELNQKLAREAERRLSLLPLERPERVRLIQGDILQVLTHKFLNDLEAETIVLLSFDTLMPKTVRLYVNAVVSAYPKHIMWLTNDSTIEGCIPLKTRGVIGPPGVTEKDENVRILHSDVVGDDDMFIDDDDGEDWRKQLENPKIELDSFAWYLKDTK